MSEHKCDVCESSIDPMMRYRTDDGMVVCIKCFNSDKDGLTRRCCRCSKIVTGSSRYFRESPRPFVCIACRNEIKTNDPAMTLSSEPDSYFDPMDVAGLCPTRHRVDTSSFQNATAHRLCVGCGKTVCGSGELFMDASRPYVCIDCSNKTNAPAMNPSTKPDNSHYTKGGIEPWSYIQANNLNFFEGSVVKYITRWQHKNGIEDLRKARVYIDELIRQEEGK